jgi:hypothetical protein
MQRVRLRKGVRIAIYDSLTSLRALFLRGMATAVGIFLMDGYIFSL